MDNQDKPEVGAPSESESHGTQPAAAEASSEPDVVDTVNEAKNSVSSPAGGEANGELSSLERILQNQDDGYEPSPMLADSQNEGLNSSTTREAEAGENNVPSENVEPSMPDPEQEVNEPSLNPDLELINSDNVT